MSNPNAHQWAYKPQDCDVVDQISLAEYRTNAEAWIDLMLGDPMHSIEAQLTEMVWLDAQWQALNHARFLAKTRKGVGTPGIVGALLDRGYLAGQIIAITRLLEPGSKDAKKQVVSLRRLVDEITKVRHLFTREIYVAHDATPYDWQAVRAKAPVQSGAVWTETTGPDAWMSSMRLHEEFDRLSGVKPQDRARTDIISTSVFDRLNDSLADPVLADIKTWRNKSVAHAADAFSRAAAGQLPPGFSLKDLNLAHSLLFGVFQSIAANILQKTWLTDAVPVPQYDIFESLDRPLVATEDLGSMQEFWDTHSKMRSDEMNAVYKSIIPQT